jgi:[ribosomal protein S5]-alanine N-acetyltransferase
MERMPYQDHSEPALLRPAPQVALPVSRVSAGLAAICLSAEKIARTPRGTPSADWRAGLPTLTGDQIVLRELKAGDAPALFAALSSEQVSRFISPPPATADGFGRFIDWAIRQRSAGQYLCFAVVPLGSDTPVGIFQVRSLEPAFGTAEWGFALAADVWGTGVFVDAARLMVNFAFDALGTHRLEARAALKNGRGNGALRKIGAVQEVVLRRSFLHRGEYLDQALWTILPEDRLRVMAVRTPRIAH